MVWLAGLFAWFALLVFAIANGVVREKWTQRRLGDHRARQAHTILGCAVTFGAACVLVGVTGERDAATLWTVGIAWLVATVAFECFLGRLVMKKPWAELLADYNLINGRLWPLFLAILALAPWLAARALG